MVQLCSNAFQHEGAKTAKTSLGQIFCGPPSNYTTDLVYVKLPTLEAIQ